MLAGILFIFLFMFATLGTSLFDGEVVALEDACGRWRFNTFYWQV